MRGRSRRTFVTAVLVVTTIVTASGCGKTTQSDASGGTEIRLYGTDGNMSNSFGVPLKGNASALAGMKGTTPLTQLNDDFKNRVRSIDPSVADFNYSGETYDAVVIAGLATEMAKSIDPGVIAKQLVGVTTGDTACDSVSACLGVIHAGHHPRYKGISLSRSGLTDSGEPSSATYGVLNFDRDGKIDDAKTEYVGAGDETAASTKAPPAVSTKPPKTPNTTPLRIGLLLPKTGALGFQGPPMFAAARLAVKDLNDAGGILTQQVVVDDGDDGTSPDVASATVDRFIGDGVQVIIGAGASGVTKAVLPKVVAAGRVIISPSATSDELSKLDDKGLLFRTAPPDVLQAKALTDIIMRDGHQKVAIVARNDSYGKGLAENVQSDLAVNGLKAEDVKVVLYDAKDTFDPKTDQAAVFDPLAKNVSAFGPDGILLVGYDESALVINGLLKAGAKIKPY